MAPASRHMPASGPSQRQLRVGELIRRTLSEILMRGALHDPDLAGVSITVGEVRTTPDLRQAVVHVLPLGGRNAELVIRALNRHKGTLRRQVSARLTLKHAPALAFAVDPTFDRMDATRRLLARDEVARDLDGD